MTSTIIHTVILRIRGHFLKNFWEPFLNKKACCLRDLNQGSLSWKSSAQTIQPSWHINKLTSKLLFKVKTPKTEKYSVNDVKDFGNKMYFSLLNQLFCPNRNILEILKFLLHFQWLFWSTFGWNTIVLLNILLNFRYISSSGKILDHLWHEREKNFFSIFCDISSGKIEENMGLNSKTNFFFQFFVTFPVAKLKKIWDYYGKELFWIFCDISSGKFSATWDKQKPKRFFLIFCDIFSGKNHKISWMNKGNFSNFVVTFPVAILEYIWVKLAKIYNFLWHFQRLFWSIFW